MKSLLSVFVLMITQYALASEALFYSAKSNEIIENEYCNLAITVPVLSAGVNATPEQTALVDRLNRQWDEMLENVTAEFKKEIKADQNSCSSLGWSNEVNITFTILSQLNSPVMSFSFDDYRFTGGAHGYNATSFITFNQFTGEVYDNLGAFIDNANLDKLKTLLEAELLLVDPDFDLTFGWNDWKTSTTNINMISNYYFDANGLVLYFNQYEIASYAAGPIEIRLNWYNLESENLLIPNGPGASILPSATP